MEFTVFYAWQDDRPRKVNRFFIRDAVQDAIDDIARGGTIDDSPRPEDGTATPKLDHDTKGVPGIPEIAATIFKKIDACGVYVADLTYVATTSAIEDKPAKQVPNPNVMTETGYALARLGPDRIILVINEAFGNAVHMPFDLAHRRRPIAYTLAASDDRDQTKAIRRRLAGEIESALRAMIKSQPLRNGDGKKRRVLANILADAREEVPQLAKSLGAAQPRSSDAEFILCGGEFVARGFHLVLKDVGVHAVAETPAEDAALTGLLRAYNDFKISARALDEFTFSLLHPHGSGIVPGYTSVVVGGAIRVAVGFSEGDAYSWTTTSSYRVNQGVCTQSYDRVKHDQQFKSLLDAAVAAATACEGAVESVKTLATLV